MREGTRITLIAIALCEEAARLLDGHVCEFTGVTIRAPPLCEEGARLLLNRLLNRLDDCRTCVSMRRRRAATRHGGGVGGCASRDGRSLTRDIMSMKLASVCLSSSISWRICVRSRWVIMASLSSFSLRSLRSEIISSISSILSSSLILRENEGVL